MDHDPFVPTPDLLIHPKLELARIQPGETLFDIGCGDGRVLIAAAKNYAVRGVGIEIRPDLVARAREAVSRHALDEHIEIRQQDYREADLTQADVVILYLSRGALGQVSLKLEQEIRPGARIVTHDFDLPGWSAEREVVVVLPHGEETRLYCYRKGAE